MKHLIKIAALLFSNILLLNACTDSENTSDNKIDYEALYQERFEAYASGAMSGLNVYNPLADVSGSEEYKPLPKATLQTISNDSLKKAISYGAANNSKALLIWKDGVLESETYYDSTDEDTLINSRSLAKPLTTIAIGAAIKTGFIESVDQSASDFITEWQDTPKADILVRHLLDMRSGLLPQGPAKESTHVLNRAYLHPRHAEVIINEYPLVGVPGDRYDYANANSELIAVIIERATGQKYQQWVSQEILQPIGAKGGQIWLNREGGTAHSGCCILLPAETYMRLGILLLQDGVWDGTRLLPDGFVEDMRTPTVQNPHSGMGVYIAGEYIERRGPLNPDIPLGQNLHSEPYLADDLFLFDGNSNQVGYIIPSANLVILRVGGKTKDGEEWDNSYLPNTIIRGIEFSPENAPSPQVQ